MRQFEQSFNSFIIASLLLVLLLSSNTVSCKTKLELGESPHLRFVGCFNISPFLTQIFKIFPNDMLLDNNAFECRKWCLDRRVITPENSLLLIQNQFCVCTTWKQNDLKGPLFKLMQDMTCIHDDDMHSFSIYQYNDLEEHTTIEPINYNIPKICTVGKCGNFHSDFINYHTANISHTTFTPNFSNETFPVVCINLGLSLMPLPSKSEELSNRTAVFISINPVQVKTEGIIFNCTAFIFLENSFPEYIEILLNYFETFDSTDCCKCSYDGIGNVSDECDEAYKCGGFKIEGDEILELTSLYYLTYEEYCTPIEIPCPIDQTTEHTTITSSLSTTSSEATSETDAPSQTPTSESPTLSSDVSSSSTTPSTEEVKVTTDDDDIPRTTTTPSSIVISCEEKQRCEQYDSWNNLWTACTNEIAFKECTSDLGSYASWKCLPNAKFEGLYPDYSNCQSKWIEEIDEAIDKIPSIPANATTQLLDKIYSRVKESMEENKQNYYGHEIKHIFYLGKKLIDKVNETTDIPTFEYLSYKTIGIMTMFCQYQKPWEDLDLMNRTETGTEFIRATEFAAFELTERIAKNQSYISDENYRNEFNASGLQMGCGAQLKDKLETNEGKISYPFKYIENYGDYIKIPDNWTDYFPGKYKDVQFVAMQIDSMLVNTVFPANLSGRISKELDHLPSNQIINSKLLSFTFNSTTVPRARTGLNFSGTGIKIHFTHEVYATGEKKRTIRRKLHLGESPRAVLGTSKCVFWDTENLTWSSEGCQLIETCKIKTKCECFHLSSFALLMDTHNYVGKDKILEVVTWILCTVSVICLITCILIFTTMSKSSRGPRTDITTNLCICLLIGNILLLTFSDRNYFHLSESICALFGSLLHYFFLSAFIWMGIEGIQLYRKVIIIFDSGKDYKLLEFVAGYGLPILIVGTTWTIGVLKSEDVYGGDEFCWLEGNYIWAFLGPILIVSIANLTILIISLRIAYKIEKNPKSHMIGSQKANSTAKWIRGAMSISVLLGVTWILGFLMLAYEMSIFISYLFTILNASQGILLFIFHCYMNANVMETVHRKLCIGSSFKSSMTRKTDSSTLKLASNSSSSSSFNTNFSKRNFN